ncbi:MAG: mannonate dehydratase [Anaerolineae bacterium]|nr:mannonate dehydratase [Anaerolineae bacterium]
MKIGLRSHTGAADRLLFAQQIGAQGVSIWASACPGYEENCYVTTDAVRDMRERCATYDLELTGIGIGGDCVKNQLLGLPERDQDIENVCTTIRSIGEAYRDVTESGGVPSPVVIIDQRTTYFAKAGSWWHPGYERNSVGRGGSELTTFHADRIVGELDDRPAGEVANDAVWERIQYFYERIVPVAEEANVRLATHPDDPPMDLYRGVAQALTGFAGLKKFVDLVPSPMNGLLLCLGVMQERGENVPELIRYFGERDKIFYVHFRNVIGSVQDDPPQYIEVWPDEGDGDMVANFRTLKEIGYTGYIVPDHHIGIAGDDEWLRYSRAWQVGYLHGVIQALG